MIFLPSHEMEISPEFLFLILENERKREKSGNFIDKEGQKYQTENISFNSIT